MSQRNPSSEAPCEIYVAAFGKHPGWNDHIDDPGVDTDALVTLKRLLYYEGVGGNIDSGAWENLPADRKVEGFDHLFLWSAGGEHPGFVIGKMWSSRDGKGRSKYPMVVCVQCPGLPLQWLLATLPKRLNELQSACIESTTADQVRDALRATRRRIEAELTSVSATAPHPLENAVKELHGRISSSSNGGDDQGMLRILYQIDREMGAFRPVGKSSTSVMKVVKGSSYRAQQIRVPQLFDDAGESLMHWLAFFLKQVYPRLPLLLMCRLDQRWVDVIVGLTEGAAAQPIFALRAGFTEIPLATDIPYTFEDDFVHQANEFMQRIEQSGGIDLESFGLNPGDSRSSAAAARLSAKPDTEVKGGWLRRLLGARP